MKTVNLSKQELIEVKKSIKDQLSSFANSKILVVGDVGLDEYIHGTVQRISPEAPVPVLDVKEVENRLGLAANVAQNISHLKGQCTLVSVVGSDKNSEVLKKLCNESQISTHFIVDEHRPTTIKTRVLHGSHHIVRVDRELKKYIAEDTESKILIEVFNMLADFDAVIIEDYNKGVVTESLAQKIIKKCKEHQVPVLVDPHLTTPAHFYKGADLLKPNINEVYSLLKKPQHSIQAREIHLHELAEELKQELSLKQVLLTLGHDGMALLENDQLTLIPTLAKQVFDVTGAGDTVIAVLALAQSVGLNLVQSSYMANLAAGIVVSKVGTVTCKYEELNSQLKA